MDKSGQHFINKTRIKYSLIEEIDYWFGKIEENKKSSLDTEEINTQYRFNVNHAKALYYLIDND